MENPGLIFLKVSFICKECVISTIVHQIVHQWTGVRITIDSFDNIWISEGLTGYITSQILQQLQKWNRIPWKSYPLNEWLQYYSSKVALAVIDGRYTAVDRGEGYWLQSYFYAKLGNTIANLDDFMGHTLMQVKHASFCDVTTVKQLRKQKPLKWTSVDAYFNLSNLNCSFSPSYTHGYIHTYMHTNTHRHTDINTVH